MRSTVARLATLLGLLSSGLARADETAGAHFSLSWVRMPGASPCVGGQDLARAVEERLRRPVFGPLGQADVAVEGHVAPAPNGAFGFHADVTLTDEKGVLRGTRSLDSRDPTCRDLEAPLALAIALMIDPNATLATPASPAPLAAPPSPAIPPPALVPVPTMPTPETPAPRSGSAPAEPSLAGGWQSSLAAGGALAQGLLPNTAAGVVARVTFLPPNLWPIAVHGAYWAEQEVPVGSAQPPAFSLAYVGLSVCPLFSRAKSLGWAVCAGAEGGALSTRGLLDSDIAVHHRGIANLSLRGEGTYAITGHIFAMLGAEIALPLVREHFDYGRAAGSDPPSDPLFQMSWLAAIFDVGLGLRSP